MDKPELNSLVDSLGTPGGKSAAALLPLVYDELRQIARGIMGRDNENLTLQPTALVNEACARLLGPRQLSWNDRAHFMAIAAQAMRQVLASHIRVRAADKRSAPGRRVTLSDIPGESIDVDPMALHETLEELATLNSRHARLVELRFFGGLNLEEAAFVMEISQSAASRDWRAARAWLSTRLRPADGADHA